jgi:hypothetical protein
MASDINRLERQAFDAVRRGDVEAANEAISELASIARGEREIRLERSQELAGLRASDTIYRLIHERPKPERHE